MIFTNRHYIRLNQNNDITKIFSDAFEQPEEGDICITENGGRHVILLDNINPRIINDNGLYIYKYINNEIIEKTLEELQNEFNSLPLIVQPPTSEERLSAVEDAITVIMGVKYV